jgi:hypothetical protein
MFNYEEIKKRTTKAKAKIEKLVEINNKHKRNM